MDTLKELGALALASRLKRLSEKLSKDVSNVYKDLNFDFEARWFTLFYTLAQNQPMAVTELAQSLSISHTAVNQLAEELLRKEYISAAKGAKDARQRLLKLSKKGKTLYQNLKPVWEKIEIANLELLNNSCLSFLADVARLEDELEESSMYERVFKHINGSLPGNIKLHEYSPKMKKYFKQLNYEWLEEFFTIEEKDRKILSNPKNIIIDQGGAILFAEIDNSIAATCAIIKHPNGNFELAKMAVTKKYRSRGIGQQLLEAAAIKAEKLGATELFLLTNASLIAANVLYKKFGFVKIDEDPFGQSGYERETYAMKYSITNLQAE